MAQDNEVSSGEAVGADWDVPAAPWATAISSKRDSTRRLPQAIAHRGYKALWPENTMAAFEAAVKAGAHGLETDVHLTGDGVAVLSHDATLLRCFGIDRALRDCTWEYLSGLRTLQEPRQSLPRLRDLLEWLVAEDKLASGDGDDVDGIMRPWVLLDIKVDEDAQNVVAAISTAISEVTPSPSAPWEKRIVLGCWNASFLQACRGALPSFPLAHIGFSLSYAGHFVAFERTSFNMAFHTLVRPLYGRRFMRRLAAGPSPRALYAWTVNHPRWMAWCLRQRDPRGEPLIDGVVTDDPALYLDICRWYEDELDGLPGAHPHLPGGSGRVAYWTETLGLLVGIATRHVGSKLWFWYRRFVEGKLDLPRSGGAVKQE